MRTSVERNKKRETKNGGGGALLCENAQEMAPGGRDCVVSFSL